MAYAEVSDIEARWRTLTAEEQTRAAALLDDASVRLDALVVVNPEDEKQQAALKTVCCSMVIRAMAATQADSFGVSQTSITAGPYTRSFSYNNPSGDMYLTRDDRKMLGIIGSYIGEIQPKIGDDA